MGFLQKGWNWEQTDPVQGEEKPVESRKWLWALSLLAFALSMFVLYHVEHTIYGEIIETNTLTFGSIMLSILLNIYEEPPEQKRKWERARTFVFDSALVCVRFPLCCGDDETTDGFHGAADGFSFACLFGFTDKKRAVSMGTGCGDPVVYVFHQCAAGSSDPCRTPCDGHYRNRTGSPEEIGGGRFYRGFLCGA